jgi:hypothetical protein
VEDMCQFAKVVCTGEAAAHPCCGDSQPQPHSPPEPQPQPGPRRFKPQKKPAPEPQPQPQPVPEAIICVEPDQPNRPMPIEMAHPKPAVELPPAPVPIFIKPARSPVPTLPPAPVQNKPVPTRGFLSRWLRFGGDAEAASSLSADELTEQPVPINRRRKHERRAANDVKQSKRVSVTVEV